jgi:hypothetical protein
VKAAWVSTLEPEMWSPGFQEVVFSNANVYRYAEARTGQAKLGEENTLYYNEKLGRWVEPGKEVGLYKLNPVYP